MHRSASRTLTLAALLAAGLAMSSVAAQSPGDARRDGGLRDSGPGDSGTVRLCDSIEAPFAYVSLSTEHADGTAEQPNRGGAVLSLLTDPALDELFAERSGASDEEREAGNGAAPTLALVRGVLRHGARDFEMVMTGIAPGRGVPLVVLRARLRQGQADQLRESFGASDSPARPGRELGGHRTFEIPSRIGAGPGRGLELALVGDDFVIGNDSRALAEVLAPEPQRTAAGQPERRVLSSDPRFRALRDRLDLPSGSLLAYGDWQRLGRRLGAQFDGVPAQLLGSSGLGSASSVMITVAPVAAHDSESGFDATLLMSFAAGDDRHEPHRESGREPRFGRGPSIDGWFAATKPVEVRQLMRELPRSGLGGLVLSVDLRAVASHSHRSSRMVWGLHEAFDEFGLDFERNVLERLGERGTVQLHFGSASPGDEGGGVDPVGLRGGAFASVSAVYAMRAKSRAKAQDLFGDLARVAGGTGFGELHELRHNRRRLDVLELRGPARDLRVFTCVHDESLLLARSRETLVQVYDDLQRAKPRGRSEQVSARHLKAIGGESVAGLFDIDLAPLLEHLGQVLPGVDLGALPTRHLGYLDIDESGGDKPADEQAGKQEANDREAGTVVRVRVLSSR